MSNGMYDIKLTDSPPKWWENILDSEYPLFARPIRDHVKFTRNGMVVFQPYRTGMEDFEELIAFCKTHELDFFVDGVSPHSDMTYKIVLWRKKYSDRRTI